MCSFDLRHKDDFDQVYDLDDPRPYFVGLSPSEYRMPGVLCAFLRRVTDRLLSARNKSTLRILDFACGYGTNGALLRHRIGLDEVFAYFARERWSADHGQGNWEPDRRFFGALRRDLTRYHIAGMDIAPKALAYAQHMGFIDAGFTDDLAVSEASAPLTELMPQVDLVIESGSLGSTLHTTLPKLVKAGARRPWFLYCPRPDVDWQPLKAAWAKLEYEPETCNTVSIRYRKPLGPSEALDIERLAAKLGVAPQRTFGDGFLLVDLVLARPQEDLEIFPIAELAAGCDDLW